MELVPDSALVNRRVMVVWHGGTSPEVLQPLVERLRGRVGEKGRVMLENADRLESSECKKKDNLHNTISLSLSLLSLSPFPLSLPSVLPEESSVEVVLSGFLPPPTLTHSPPLLAVFAKLLRPSGALFLREPVTTTASSETNTHTIQCAHEILI